MYKVLEYINRVPVKVFGPATESQCDEYVDNRMEHDENCNPLETIKCDED